jgi:CBS-domain-containing membrane protein
VDSDERVRIPEGPIGGQLASVLRGLLVRFRFSNLSRRYNSPWLLATFSFINGCVAIALMATVAVVTHEPFVFPSLGPTAFLFFYMPLSQPACPRNTLVGHSIGALVGWGSLMLFGLQDIQSSLHGVMGPHVGAAALALGLTCGLLVLLMAPHPPAGATTLIFALGALHTFGHVVILMAAVVLLTAQAIIINRLAGLPYPLWAPVSQSPTGSAAPVKNKT